MSRIRRWLGAMLLLAVVAGGLTYHRLTDENRLRRQAQRWLTDFTGGDVRIDQIRFGLSEGLHLAGVTVAVPASASFDPGDDSLAARTVFHAEAVFLRFRPLSAITGRLIVPEIVAVRPRLMLVHRLVDGRWNWETLLRNRKPLPDGQIGPLPVVRLRNAEIIQVRIDERGRTQAAPRKLWVEARPRAGRKACYDVELTQVRGQPGGGTLSRETTHLLVDMRTLEASGSLPSVALADLLLTAPVELTRWLDACGLRGSIQADDFKLKPGGTAEALLTVRDASLALPMNEAERAVAAEQRFLHIEGVGGTIRLAGREATVTLEGRLRSCPVMVKGTLRLGDRPPEEQVAGKPRAYYPAENLRGSVSGIGFDLEVRLTDFPLPRGDSQDPAERRLIESWPVVAEQVVDFDGIGKVDVTIRLERESRADADVRFIEGTVDLKGCSARYAGFPYRINELSGQVWIRPDGRIELQKIVGRHGRGTVTTEGLLGGRVSKQGDLTITGKNIVLDDDLLVCLNQSDRDLIGRFNATARANVSVRMQRPARRLDEPAAAWQTEIDIRFLDGTINMVDFPYPFERLTGRMRIAGERLEVSDFCVRRGDTRVCVEGVAQGSSGGAFGYDLRVEASSLVLDEVLGRALPEASRRLYNEFKPTGRGELTGRLFSRQAGGPLDCDLKAVIGDASLSLPGSEQRLTDCRATLAIRPDVLTVESLAGRFGESPVRAEGLIPLAEGDDRLLLNVDSERMVLDDRLRSILPAGAQAAWNAFEPSGVAAFDLRYMRGFAATSAPAASRPAATPDYTLAIEPIDCRVRYGEFPLPLSGVNGRIVVQPGRVLIERLKARHEEAVIEGIGLVELGREQTVIVLTLDAKGLAFTETLRQALPWRLRRLWNDLKPAGRFDLQFDKLVLTCPAGGQITWVFDGSAVLRDTALSIGPRLSGIEGRIQASGEVGEDFALQGDLQWSRVRLEDWEITDLTGGFSQPRGSGRMAVRGLQGQLYHGKVIGEVDLMDAPRGTEYGLSVTARDVSLGDFLNARLRPGEQPVTLKGVVDGNLALAGRFNDYASRRGGGAVLIHHAQMLKVPFILTMMQVVHLVVDDDNAFHDARLTFIVDGDDLLLQEIDLRGKALSMVGAGRVKTPTEVLNLVLLVGSPLRLPRIEVLSELVEGLARELVEVYVEGRLGKPNFRAEIVRSVRRTVEAVLNAREKRQR
ncbi:MAG TPA: hypothetical protein VLM89_00735 [Phycisphaerae bacterium]|nr:hypothetical protein [Phycisphaerae bacterium]